MAFDTYMDQVIPFIKTLIDQKKITEQKIQLDVGISLTHIIDNRRIKFYSRSKNVICLPSSNTEDVLIQLTTPLQYTFREDLLLCRTSSSYQYESVEELNIHFHKVDLQRSASYIETADWLKKKKAIINPKNTKDGHCFMYAATISLYHKELGRNPERISKKLIEHISKLKWKFIGFPALYSDYQKFERLNGDIALNVLYVPFNEKTVCSEYISNRNHTTKK